MLRKEFDFLHSTLQTETSFIDFAHVRSLLLGHNDKVLKQKSTIQGSKFSNSIKDKKVQHDTDRIIFNCSSYVLSEAEKPLLLNGLNFEIPPKKLNHADCLVNFELFYWDIRNLQVLSAENLDFIETKTRDIALSSFHTYSNNVPNIYQKENLML